MKKIFIIVNILVVLIPGFLRAQIFPDYKERNISKFSDSTITDLQIISATEGSIDPEVYILGPGDKLFVSISGLEETAFNLLIDQQGNLYLPKVGGIDLKNSTLQEGKQKIFNAVSRYYKNVDIFVTLVDFRKIKVSLLGNVNKPASHILTANSRLMDIITKSQGLTESSNYRNIKIISRSGEEKTYDLLSYLRFGDLNNNPYLQEGDIVLIDRADEIVTIYGEIKYPGIYEFINGEPAINLINLAGGFTLKARRDTIEIVSFSDDGKKQQSAYYTVDELNQNNIELKSLDRIIVRQMPEYFEDRYVKIEGFIKYPGWYKIVKDNTTLTQIIIEAGGFLEDASLSEALLTRAVGLTQSDPEFERLKLMLRADMTDDEYDYLKAKSRERVGKVVVNFEKLFLENDSSEDIILKRGDVITIPEAKNYVTLLGQVVNPGKIIYNENLSYEDYIELAGGFGWRALENKVRVIKANTGEWIEADDIDSLDPGDTIWIPEDPPGPKFWDVFTTTLAVVGQLAAIVAATVAVIIASR